jgi:4'-phosphopantetheinyl transferase
MGEWRDPPPAPDLRPDAVDVWRASFAAADSLHGTFEGTLSPAEKTRAATFAFEPERRRFVASRGLLRVLLARYSGTRPDAQEIVADADGKPRLGGRCGQGRIRFNVSHSGDLWACAVALHREVGLDVEAMRPDRHADRIAERYFAPAEVAALRALPEPERAAAFHRCWTRKEAFLKAKGIAVTVPLDSFEVTLGPGEPARLLATRPDPAEATRWRLHDLDFGSGFAGALCVEGEAREVRPWRWSAG